MENHLIVWFQRFRKTKNSEMLLNILYVINKNLFLFLLIYKREILLNILYYQKNKDLSTQKYGK